MQSGITRNAGMVWSTAVVASLVVLVASVVGPRPAFATLCHQLPARSFLVADHLFAVCHRCTGIYTGIFFGLLIVALPSVRSAVSRFGLGMVVAALALVLLDFGFDLLGIVANTSVSRALTGFGLGLSGGAFLGVSIGVGGVGPAVGGASGAGRQGAASNRSHQTRTWHVSRGTWHVSRGTWHETNTGRRSNSTTPLPNNEYTNTEYRITSTE